MFDVIVFPKPFGFRSVTYWVPLETLSAELPVVPLGLDPSGHTPESFAGSLMECINDALACRPDSVTASEYVVALLHAGKFRTFMTVDANGRQIEA